MAHTGGALALRFQASAGKTFLLNALEVLGPDERRARDPLRRRAERHPARARRSAGDRPRRSPRGPARGVRVADGASPGRWLPGRPGGGSALVVHLGVSRSARCWRAARSSARTATGSRRRRCSICSCSNRCRRAASRSPIRARGELAKLPEAELDAIRAKTWMNLADIGSTVSALAFAIRYVTGERQARYRAAVRRYLDEWARPVPAAQRRLHQRPAGRA